MIFSPEQVVIDCREQTRFLVLHYSHSVNIPVAQLFWRMQELPQKDVALTLIVDKDSKQPAVDFFNEREFQLHQVIDWQQLQEDDAVEKRSGKSDCFFWQPSAFIKQFSETFLAKQQSLTVLDLACGSGRDAIYLAMQGHRVYGLDYSETALQRAKISAEYHGVTLQLNCVDLEKSFSFEQLSDWPVQFDAIIVCRYLHRPLFAAIKNGLLPKGWLAYHTFMQGSEKFGSPRNPNYLLRESELAQTFADFSILQNEVIHLSDGRPMSAFVARKP